MCIFWQKITLKSAQSVDPLRLLARLVLRVRRSTQNRPSALWQFSISWTAGLYWRTIPTMQWCAACWQAIHVGHQVGGTAHLLQKAILRILASMQNGLANIHENASQMRETLLWPLEKKQFDAYRPIIAIRIMKRKQGYCERWRICFPDDILAPNRYSI